MRTIIQRVIADLEREAVIPVGGITVTKESAPCDNHPKREEIAEADYEIVEDEGTSS